jgi:uncharacterized protein YxjI
MNLIFEHNRYLLKRQVFSLLGNFRIYDPMGNPVMFGEQKRFSWGKDIRVYSDENETQEVLMIRQRQIKLFSLSLFDCIIFDVVDSVTDQKIGALRKSSEFGWLDQWHILDTTDNLIGILFKNSKIIKFWSQNYDITMGSKHVANLKWRFNLFTYQVDIGFSGDKNSIRKLDHRVGIAAGIVLQTLKGGVRLEIDSNC